MQKNLIALLLVVGSICAGSISAEILFQGYSWIRTGNKLNLSKRDDVLGWTASENADVARLETTEQGQKYEIYYQTDQLGFRIIPQISTAATLGNTNILVIGDSFTGGAYASNDKMWYAMLQKKLPLNVYAHGQSGYGTFQEYLLFKKIYKHVKPEILLIQFCPNDILNDYYEYSNYSIIRAQDLIRPFLREGDTVFNSNPASHVYRFLHKNSLIFRRFDLWLENAQYQKYGYDRIPEGKRSELEAKAFLNWSGIYEMFVDEARASGVKKIWSISCNPDPSNPENKLWKEESERLGVKAFLSPAQAVKLAEEKGIDVRHNDGGHWNHTGNEIAGVALVNEISKQGLLGNTQDTTD